MTYPKGQHPGAVWRKSEFQIHTPRDAQWQGSPALPGGPESSEADREAWADSFVQACIAQNLQAIAVTDHHDVVMLPYVRRAIERIHAADRIWLFPGMEVTCNDSVQCLILFNVSTPLEEVRRLFGKMPNVVEPAAELPQAPQTQLCGTDIADFLGRIYEDTALNGKSIVLPHASKGGHKNILRKGFHSRFADLQVDGVYNEVHYTTLDPATLRKIYGEEHDWGDRRHGIITTGDNRSAGYEKLGANPCWIRLGEPTAESIRQAVLADEARISYAEPEIPSHRVLRLRVSSSLTSPGFDVVINDGFTALIGGRGSGKTAILEYLRFGIGRSIIDAADDESRAREKGLIESTLAGGHVEVELDRDGVKESWRRTIEQTSIITVTVEGQDPIELTVQAAQERFRARAFYQKQLSTLVRRRETADEQITGIAAAELVDRRRQAERDIGSGEREVSLAFQRVVQGWSAEAAHARAKAMVEDLKRRLEGVRERLESGGLSAEHQKVLDAAPVYSRTENQFASTGREIADLREQLDHIVELRLSAWEGLVEADEVMEAIAAITEANEKLRVAKEGISDALDAVSAKVISGEKLFETRHAGFRAQLSVAAEAQAHLKAILEDYRRLSDELELAERAEQEAEEASRKFAGSEVALQKARAALRERLTSLKGILNEAAERVEEMSSGVLRARVEEEQEPIRYLEAITDLCERCAIRDLEAKCSAVAAETVRDASADWDRLIGELLEIRRSQIRSGGSPETDTASAAALKTALKWDLTENQAKLVLARLDDNRLARLLSAWASPLIRFEYKDRGAYMPFERASPGQQASALLTLLLNQEAGTLIIDQPEDDLDNKVIMTVVKLLQTTKRKRQLIFATHNPNFVVNGDADKVVALAPSVEPNAPEAASAAQLEIEADGAIESSDVRTQITETMEGGREAFELRSRKYSFS